MKSMMEYDRRAAVMYAHKWAHGRNPSYYNYDNLGGDCTNFASQCLLAGGCIMNSMPTYGWYYINANRKSPSWSGVTYLYSFLMRTTNTIGPKARECRINELQPGDLVQLSYTGNVFHHTPIVVSIEEPLHPRNILVAAHTDDSDYRSILTYPYKKIRFLHIEGIIKP